jgi:hypothetical protein
MPSTTWMRAGSGYPNATIRSGEKLAAIPNHHRLQFRQGAGEPRANQDACG